jgi:hypothetical protein
MRNEYDEKELNEREKWMDCLEGYCGRLENLYCLPSIAIARLMVAIENLPIERFGIDEEYLKKVLMPVE